MNPSLILEQFCFIISSEPGAKCLRTLRAAASGQSNILFDRSFPCNVRAARNSDSAGHLTHMKRPVKRAQCERNAVFLALQATRARAARVTWPDAWLCRLIYITVNINNFGASAPRRRQNAQRQGPPAALCRAARLLSTSFPSDTFPSDRMLLRNNKAWGPACLIDDANGRKSSSEANEVSARGDRCAASQPQASRSARGPAGRATSGDEAGSAGHRVMLDYRRQSVNL